MKSAGRSFFGTALSFFASKPAPTFDLQRTQNLCTTLIKCGSGLAREGVHRRDGLDYIVEFAVAHVGVGPGFITHTAGVQAERFHCQRFSSGSSLSSRSRSTGLCNSEQELLTHRLSPKRSWANCSCASTGSNSQRQQVNPGVFLQLPMGGAQLAANAFQRVLVEIALCKRWRYCRQPTQHETNSTFSTYLQVFLMEPPGA
ncbi:hypothetical protein PMI28_02262 [Pseudomonas sp. GM48]|nr:hypothetical protein PMI28_02262 [Pseudomonas sp. GM48]